MQPTLTTTEDRSSAENDSAFIWLERTLPRTMRLLMDSDNLETPLLQLPLAQLRLAMALYDDDVERLMGGETMGRLSDRLGVRHNALTQAADRLVNHKLAERLSDPHDRRIVRLRLTEQGRQWVVERRARRRARLHQVWTSLDLPERESFVLAVQTLESVVRCLEPRNAETTCQTDPMYQGDPAVACKTTFAFEETPIRSDADQNS